MIELTKSSEASINQAKRDVEAVGEALAYLASKDISVDSRGRTSILETLVEDFLQPDRQSIDKIVSMVKAEAREIVRSKGKKRDRRFFDKVGTEIIRGIKRRIMRRGTSGSNPKAYSRAKRQRAGKGLRSPQPTYGVYTGKTIDSLFYKIAESKTK